MASPESGSDRAAAAPPPNASGSAETLRDALASFGAHENLGPEKANSLILSG